MAEDPSYEVVGGTHWQP